MADVYFDEDVWLALAADFRAHNHDVATYRDYGLTRASDALHHLTATQQQRVLITFNREDYELLHDAWHYWTAAWNTSNQHSGIIVADQTVPRPVHAVSIHSLLSSDLPLANRLYEWRGGRNGGWYAISNGNGRRCLHSWMASKDLSWGRPRSASYSAFRNRTFLG